MTLSNIQLLAVGEAGGSLSSGSSTLESVGQHSIETTEINRGGKWAGVPLPWAGAFRGTETGPHPAHLTQPPKPLGRLPNAAALTQSTRPADWL